MKENNKNNGFQLRLFLSKISLLVSTLIIMASVTGCGGTTTTTSTKEKILFNQFVVIEERVDNDFGCNSIYIMYDKDSKAMYYGYPIYHGWMVPIYNEDGTVKLYDSEN